MIGSSSSLVETVWGFASGALFGLISPLAGQPFDTIKTRMQSESQFRGMQPMAVTRHVVATDGILSLYRGLLPMVLGQGMNKSGLFAANAGARRWCEMHGPIWLSTGIPGTGGLKPTVLIGAVAGSCARTALETPFEFAKVRTMTGSTARSSAGIFTPTQIVEMYTGVMPTLGRTTVMITSFFVMCDYFERFAPNYNKGMQGGFIKGGCCATLGWFFAWPFETVKSRLQGREGGSGMGTMAMMRHIVASDGVKGLWR
eukprot:CAMPEP_0180434776 /NCGR_PEP_ID=MMETSP1036_2-20121128/10131_1 /TAXON_ID=632150 /ORGANISM="Azadinium spinosum, Strain 3D9" /LENGTH=256 /DNA_ID=CAMNT_0022440663 /DNA_START=76 /DNA_END=843 /DNA_ORIENTATION=-